MISVAYQPASFTDVLSNRERLTDLCPAQTSLRCTARIDFHKQAPSFFRFVREHDWLVIGDYMTCCRCHAVERSEITILNNGKITREW